MENIIIVNEINNHGLNDLRRKHNSMDQTQRENLIFPVYLDCYIIP